MPDENWTKIMSKDVDIPAFLRNIDHVKAGWTMACPFCGGTVRMVANADGKNEYACDSCDMKKLIPICSIIDRTMTIFQG